LFIVDMLIDKLTKEERKVKIEKHFKEILIAMWIDIEKDDNFTNTPYRIAKMFIDEIFNWLYDDPSKIKFSVFDNKNKYWWIVMVGPIEIKSTCAHHFMPFVWSCRIWYIPDKKLVWLSKFSRIVDHFARKPQTQELLVEEISNFLIQKLQTQNIAVLIKAEHFCMKVRWVEEPCCNTATASMNWSFLKSKNTRQEFYKLIEI